MTDHVIGTVCLMSRVSPCSSLNGSPTLAWVPKATNTYKYFLPPPAFLLFFFSSSYLPCLGGRDHEGGPPQIGPCIAQRGGTVCSTAFGSLTGVFFGTFHPVDLLLFIKLRVSDPALEKSTLLLSITWLILHLLLIMPHWKTGGRNPLGAFTCLTSFVLLAVAPPLKRQILVVPKHLMQPSCERTSALLPRRPYSHSMPNARIIILPVHTVTAKLFCHEACLLMYQVLLFGQPWRSCYTSKASTLSPTPSLRLCNSRQIESIF